MLVDQGLWDFFRVSRGCSGITLKSESPQKRTAREALWEVTAERERERERENE